MISVDTRSLSDIEILRVQEAFAKRAGKMLRDMAKHGNCQCGAKPGASEFGHIASCSVSVMLRAARAVEMLGEGPSKKEKKDVQAPVPA